MSAFVVLRAVCFEWPDGRTMFSNMDLSFGDRVSCLVGPNGIGKTCLARLIVGDLEPQAGEIYRSCSVGYFAQREEPPETAVSLYLADVVSEWDALAQRLLESIPMDQICSHLSGGQWMRVRLARAILTGSRFLILDEPTNDLDREGRDLILKFVTHFDGGLLLISHDRELLQRGDNIIELSNQGLKSYGHSWTEYEQEKNRERQRLADDLRVAKREREEATQRRVILIERQQKRQRQGAKAAKKGGLPRILVGARKRRAEATSGKVDASTFQHAEDTARQAWEAYSQLKVDPVMYSEITAVKVAAKRLIADTRDFNVRYDDQDEWLFRSDLNFIWKGPVRVAVRGANGRGKSTLLHLLAGDPLPLQSRGHLEAGKLNWLYIDQRCSTLVNEESVFENVRRTSAQDETEIRNHLAKFLFFGDRVFQEVRTLSGGERLRATLAKAFLSTAVPEVIMLDEPTNNLDLQNIEFLEGLLSAFTGALLVVSHDEVFLEKIDMNTTLEL